MGILQTLNTSGCVLTCKNDHSFEGGILKLEDLRPVLERSLNSLFQQGCYYFSLGYHQLGNGEVQFSLNSMRKTSQFIDVNNPYKLDVDGESWFDEQNSLSFKNVVSEQGRHAASRCACTVLTSPAAPPAATWCEISLGLTDFILSTLNLGANYITVKLTKSKFCASFNKELSKQELNDYFRNTTRYDPKLPLIKPAAIVGAIAKPMTMIEEEGARVLKTLRAATGSFGWVVEDLVTHEVLYLPLKEYKPSKEVFGHLPGYKETVDAQQMAQFHFELNKDCRICYPVGGRGTREVGWLVIKSGVTVQYLHNMSSYTLSKTKWGQVAGWKESLNGCAAAQVYKTRFEVFPVYTTYPITKITNDEKSCVGYIAFSFIDIAGRTQFAYFKNETQADFWSRKYNSVKYNSVYNSYFPVYITPNSPQQDHTPTGWLVNCNNGEQVGFIFNNGSGLKTKCSMPVYIGDDDKQNFDDIIKQATSYRTNFNKNT